jgi:hypothetical protein
MKRYIMGLVLSGIVSRIARRGSALVPGRARPAGGIGKVLIGAGIGAGLTWLLEKRKRDLEGQRVEP